MLAGELPLYCCRQHRQSVRLQAPASKIFVLKRRKLLELEKTELRVATGHMCFRSAHAYDQNTASQSQSQSPWQMLAKSQGPSDLRIAKMLSAEDPAMAGRQVKLLMQSRRISARPSSVSCMASSLSFLDTIRLLHFSLAFFMLLCRVLKSFLTFVVQYLDVFPLVCMVSSLDTMPSKRVFMPVALALAASASAKELISSQSLS